MAYTDIKTEHVNQSQTLRVTRVVKGPKNLRLRVTIKRNAYDSQSSAVVDTWTANGWTEVIRHSDINTLRIGVYSYVSRDEAAWHKAIDADAVDLLDLACNILL